MSLIHIEAELSQSLALSKHIHKVPLETHLLVLPTLSLNSLQLRQHSLRQFARDFHANYSLLASVIFTSIRKTFSILRTCIKLISKSGGMLGLILSLWQLTNNTFLFLMFQ